jgi:hypothetical protein
MSGGVGVTIGGNDLSARTSLITINRGRQDELARTPTGTCTVEVKYLDGDASGLIGTSGTISLDNPFGGSSTIFAGTVDEVLFDLSNTQQVTTVSVTLVDCLDYFAGIEMVPGGDFGDVPLPASVDPGNIFFEQEIVGRSPSDPTIGRVTRLVDQSGFGGSVEIFTGNVQVMDKVYAPATSILEAIDDACDAEWPGLANRFASADNTFTFHGRLARMNPSDAQYNIETYAIGDFAACAADGHTGRARVAELELGISQSRIINAALATPRGIADDEIENQVVIDAGSISTYGRRAWSAENLETWYDELNGPFAGGVGDPAEALAATLLFAQAIVDAYSVPRIQVEKCVLKSRHPEWRDAEATWELLCNADISDLVNLSVTNPGISVDDDFFIEGVTYTIRPLNGSWAHVEMGLNLSPRSYWPSIEE